MKSYNYIGKKENEPAFYYHSDHLGSASYVTNGDGKVTQTLNYLPYGKYPINGNSTAKEMQLAYPQEDKNYWSKVMGNKTIKSFKNSFKFKNN